MPGTFFFFFFTIKAAVTSFSTLYFSYVGRPRNFIGRSTRVIHRRKWRRGGSIGLARQIAGFSNPNAELHGPKTVPRHAQCKLSPRCLWNILCRSTHHNGYLKKIVPITIWGTVSTLSLCLTAGSVLKRATSLVKFIFKSTTVNNMSLIWAVLDNQ